MFARAWDSEKSKPRPSLHLGLLKYYWSSGMWWLHWVVAAEEALRIWQALALGFFLTHLSSSSSTPEAAGPAWLWAGSIVLAAVLNLFIHHLYYFYTWVYGMKLKHGAISKIYKKSLKMKAGQDITGRVMSLTTNDSDRFQIACIFVPYLFWGPVQATFTAWYGFNRLGEWFFLLCFAGRVNLG